jgi:hypothetical protein
MFVYIHIYIYIKPQCTGNEATMLIIDIIAEHHSIISGIKQSQYTQSSGKLAQRSVSTAVKPLSHARCVKPDVPIGAAAYNNSTVWPHQVINSSCPRFAMLTITTVSGLGQRFQEVCKRYTHQ